MAAWALISNPRQLSRNTTELFHGSCGSPRQTPPPPLSSLEVLGYPAAQVLKPCPFGPPLFPRLSNP
eukprot:11101106-Alexandrium_andersonii.AAC.1